MSILTINAAPFVDFEHDMVRVWADAADGGRFRMGVSREYLLDVWNVQWDDALAGFAVHQDEALALAEVASLAKEPSFELLSTILTTAISTRLPTDSASERLG